MTQLEWKEWNQAAIKGTVSDEENPIFIFGLTSNRMLAEILSGAIDIVEVAKQTLKCRGFNEKGKWVGF